MLRGCGVCFHGCRVRVLGLDGRRPPPTGPIACTPGPPFQGARSPSQCPPPSVRGRHGLGWAWPSFAHPAFPPSNSHTLLILNDARESLPVLAQLPPARTQKPNKRTCGSAPSPSPSIVDPANTAVAIRTVTDIAASPRARSGRHRTYTSRPQPPWPAENVFEWARAACQPKAVPRRPRSCPPSTTPPCPSRPSSTPRMASIPGPSRPRPSSPTAATFGPPTAAAS